MVEVLKSQAQDVGGGGALSYTILGATESS